MPKIVIKEIDNTTAGAFNYTNFSVVVPGLVKERTQVGDEWKYGGMVVSKDEIAESVFDENGVFECSSQEDFVNCIGLCSYDAAVIRNAVAPTLSPMPDIDDSSDSEDTIYVADEEIVPLPIDEAIFNIVKEEKTLYLAVEKEASDPNYGKVGLLQNETFYFVAVSPSTTYDSEALYARIFQSNAGVDEEKGEQYGNQIAYELLGLGYTILYKKFENLTELSTDEFWKCFYDKSLYDFRYIIAGLLKGNESVNSYLVNLASEETGRGDCTALLEIDSSYYEGKTQYDAMDSIAHGLGNMPASKYAALFAPYVVYSLSASRVSPFGDNKVFPASFHYLACAARAAENYNEWYAIAGYTRGVSSYVIENIGCKFGEAAIELLEPRTSDGGIERSVNLITKIKNAYYLWGNRTAYELNSSSSANGGLRASHFLNIRQLCSTIKKQVYIACRKFTFDPNSDLLWVNFCNAIRPTLEKMKSDQGIADYKFVKVTNKQKALLTAKIRIVPIEAVEDFEIKLFLEDSLGGITVESEEGESIN